MQKLTNMKPPTNPNSGERIVNETYLGDGVYASFDGANVWLRAPRTGTDHFVALNIDNWPALRSYVFIRLGVDKPTQQPPEDSDQW